MKWFSILIPILCCLSASCSSDKTCPRGYAPSATSCVLSDADTDGAVHCLSACPDALHAILSCGQVDRCDFTCDPGYEDCDYNQSNGCETSLGSIYHCGACGLSCEAGEQCSEQKCVAVPETLATIFGDLEYDSISAVAVDADDYVYAAGYFAGTVNIGTTELHSNDRDIFVFRMNADAELQWAISDPKGNSDDYVESIALSDAGLFLLSTRFEDDPDDPSDGDTREELVTAYPLTGTTQRKWRGGIVGPRVDFGNHYITAFEEQVFVAFSLPEGSISVSDVSSSTWCDAEELNKSLNERIALLKINANSGECDSYLFPSTSTVDANGIFADTSGNLYLVGAFQGTVSVDTKQSISNSDQIAIFVARFDEFLSLQWIRKITGVIDSNVVGAGIVAENRFGVVARVLQGNFGDDVPRTGRYYAQYDAQGAPVLLKSLGDFYSQNNSATETIISTSLVLERSKMIIRDTNGEIRWIARQFPRPPVAAIDSKGHFWIGGYFDGAITLAGKEYITNGYNDAYLLRMDPR